MGTPMGNQAERSNFSSSAIAVDLTVLPHYLTMRPKDAS